jgi:hypothetical protein
VKRFLLICLTFFTFAPLYGQLSVGAKAGGTFVQRQQPESGAYGWSSSYHAGLALNVYLAEFSFGGFAVQPEILYNRKGEHAGHLEYLELPVGVSYLLNFGNVIPYIFAAPYYAFLVNVSTYGREESDVSYAKTDYGLKLGGGVELRYFQLSASYGKGMRSVAKGGAASARNVSAEISLAYFFLR